MNLPFWVWSAIAGALGGGLGAALGWLLERAGFRFGRWFSVVGIAAALAFAQSATFRGIVNQVSWTEANTEDALVEMAPEVYSYLKVAFPDDFQQLVRESTDAIRNASGRSDVERRSAEIMQAMRKKYAPFIRFAPDAELSQLMTEQMAFYQLVLRDDPAVCAQVAINGPISMVGTGFTQKYATAFLPQVLALFRTARSGIDKPQARREATDADWETISLAISAAGATDSDFQAIAELNAGNENTCPALLLMLRAINETGTDAAGVVRASYLAETAGS